MAEDRIDEPLDEEARHRVLSELRDWMEAGHCNYKLRDSLIDLDQTTYHISWPGLAKEDRPLLGAPGELISFGFNGTDAYATALLATNTPIQEGCTMTVSCRYRKHPDDSLDLYFSSMTDTFMPTLSSTHDVAQFLNGFVPALESKNITPHGPVFCDSAGAPAWFGSPGKMLYSKSVLSQIPEPNWPVATRTFVVTQELRIRARNAVLLLTTPDSKMYHDPA